MLDPTDDELRHLARACADFAVRSLGSMPGASPVGPDGGAVLADAALRRDPPEDGRPLAELLEVLDRAAAPA